MRSEHRFRPHFWCNAVEPLGEFRKMTSRHIRKEMMLQMIEHAVRDDILEPSTLCAGNVCLVAVVMDSPDGEEPRKTFSGRHDEYETLQSKTIIYEEH